MGGHAQAQDLRQAAGVEVPSRPQVPGGGRPEAGRQDVHNLQVRGGELCQHAIRRPLQGPLCQEGVLHGADRRRHRRWPGHRDRRAGGAGLHADLPRRDTGVPARPRRPEDVHHGRQVRRGGVRLATGRPQPREARAPGAQDARGGDLRGVLRVRGRRGGLGRPAGRLRGVPDAPVDGLRGVPLGHGRPPGRDRRREVLHSRQGPHAGRAPEEARALVPGLHDRRRHARGGRRVRRLRRLRGGREGDSGRPAHLPGRRVGVQPTRRRPQGRGVLPLHPGAAEPDEQEVHVLQDTLRRLPRHPREVRREHRVGPRRGIRREVLLPDEPGAPHLLLLRPEEVQGVHVGHGHAPEHDGGERDPRPVRGGHVLQHGRSGGERRGRGHKEVRAPREVLREDGQRPRGGGLRPGVRERPGGGRGEVREGPQVAVPGQGPREVPPGEPQGEAGARQRLRGRDGDRALPAVRRVLHRLHRPRGRGPGVRGVRRATARRRLTAR